MPVDISKLAEAGFAGDETGATGEFLAWEAGMVWSQAGERRLTSGGMFPHACHRRPCAGHYRYMSTPTAPTDAEFRKLYERTSTRVYGYVRRYCQAADCADVIAEVYLVAWRRFDQLPVDPVPWLFGTARKVLANLWRSRDRRARLDAELCGLYELATPDVANQAVDRADLLQALAALEPDDREILLLTGWDGLDSSAAGKVLGVSAVAARARLSRARRRLIGHVGTTGSSIRPSLSLLTEGN